MEYEGAPLIGFREFLKLKDIHIKAPEELKQIRIQAGA